MARKTNVLNQQSPGAYLREKREAAGVKQVEIEELTGINQQDISRIETGITKRPQEETLRLLAEAIPGLDLDELTGRFYFPDLYYQIPETRRAVSRLDADKQRMVAIFAEELKLTGNLENVDEETARRLLSDAITLYFRETGENPETL